MCRVVLARYKLWDRFMLAVFICTWQMAFGTLHYGEPQQKSKLDKTTRQLHSNATRAKKNHSIFSSLSDAESILNFAGPLFVKMKSVPFIKTHCKYTYRNIRTTVVTKQAIKRTCQLIKLGGVTSVINNYNSRLKIIQ